MMSDTQQLNSMLAAVVTVLLPITYQNEYVECDAKPRTPK